jgi:hypothetical protein
MKTPRFQRRLLRLLSLSAFLVACGAPPVIVPPTLSPTLPPPPPSSQPPPPPPTRQSPPPPPGSAPALVSDFAPCVGAPPGTSTVPRAGRALIAHSTNGLDFQHPTNLQDGLLIDGAGMPDGVVLPSGRILIYFVNGCRDSISVAVSDQQGAPGSWTYKDVRFAGIPETLGPNPVDPNVVLLPDGGLRLFVTVFRSENDSVRTGAYSFLSTDGGFAFAFEGMRYDDIADPEAFRFSDSIWQILTGGPRGHALSTDGGDTFQSLGPFADTPGAPHEVAVTERPGEFRAYFTSPSGITSYLSTSEPWTTWTEEPGHRLQLDSTAGLESCEVAVPTVLRLGPGNYLMVYLTRIPGCSCGGEPITCQ